MGFFADILNLPKDLERGPALMREWLPAGCLIATGAILAAPGALRLGQGHVPIAFVELFSPVMWWIAVFVLLMIGVNRMGAFVKKCVGESGPSLERSKEFIRLVASLKRDEVNVLQILADGTELVTTNPAWVPIDTAGLMTAVLTSRSRSMFPTDGKNRICIAEPYRPFLFEWSKGRALP